MFTSIHPTREEACAFDERTAATFQATIAYLSEIVTNDRTELVIGFLQSQLERHGHEYKLTECLFLRDCMVAHHDHREGKR